MLVDGVFILNMLMLKGYFVRYCLYLTLQQIKL